MELRRGACRRGPGLSDIPSDTPSNNNPWGGSWTPTAVVVNVDNGTDGLCCWDDEGPRPGGGDEDGEPLRDVLVGRRPEEETRHHQPETEEKRSCQTMHHEEFFRSFVRSFVRFFLLEVVEWKEERCR